MHFETKLNFKGGKNPFSQVKSWKVHKADLRYLESFNFIHGFISPSLKTTWQSTIILLTITATNIYPGLAGTVQVLSTCVSLSLHKDPLREIQLSSPHLTGRETEAQRLNWLQVTLKDICIFTALLVKEEPETEIQGRMLNNQTASSSSQRVDP